MKKALTLTLLAAITLITVNCGDKEDDFSCANNNTHTVLDDNNICATASLSYYQANTQANDEEFRITIEYGIYGSSTIKILPGGELIVGQVYSYDINKGLDNQAFIGTTQPSSGHTIDNIKGEVIVTKLDRSQNLISLTYGVNGLTDNNPNNPYTLSGTITDLYFE